MYALAVVLLAELLASRIVTPFLGAELARNPNDTRDWEDYVRATGRPRAGEIRILILSNSQAVALDTPATDIYPARLEARLSDDERRSPVRVVNWSLSGLHVPEAIVLLARAHALHPDVLLCVLPPFWFTASDYAVAGRPTPLTMFQGDVTETAWFYRDVLPPEFRAHYLTTATVVNAYLTRYWPTYRSRDVLLAAAAHRFRWLVPFLPEEERVPGMPTLHATTGDVRLFPHPALLRMFSAAAEAAGGRRIFALEPNAWHLHDAVPASLREHLGSNGWELWNLMEAVPDEAYASDRIHFLPDGHRAFAYALALRLEPLLAAMTPPPARSPAAG